MAQWSRSSDREVLGRKLKSASYQVLLHKIQATSAFFRQFDSWSAVIAFMRHGTSHDPAKDEVLRPIFAARRTASDERWNSILLAIFLPGLESMWRRGGRSDEHPDDLWSEVTWAFLHAISKVDLERRGSRLVQKVVNDTHHLYRENRRLEWDRQEREPAYGPEEIENLADEAVTPGTDETPREGAIQRLLRHQAAGRLTADDFYILVGTVVYDRPLAECADRLGLTYEAAKKRRQRALEAIRPYETRE